MVTQQLFTTPDTKVVVSAEVRIEGGHFLFAFGDEDSGHVAWPF
jgi:hypothetical protein